MNIRKVILAIVVVLAGIGPAFVLAQQQIPPRGAESIGIGGQRLMQLRAELAMELREIQRTLAIIDPNDVRLAETLKIQQADALAQLLDVEKDLKAMGINLEPARGPEPTAQQVPQPAIVPQSVPAAENPPIPVPATPSAEPQGMEEFLRAIRDGEARSATPGTTPGLPVRENIPARGQLNPLFGADEPAIPMIPGDPAEIFNPGLTPQDPWAQRPSKETQDLQKSVNALQDEVKSLRRQIESLEDQIRLLTKLLSK